MPAADWDRLYRLLGENIRARRTERGLSQRELAGVLELTRASVVNLEAGRQRPPLSTLYMIAGRLGVEPHELLPPYSEVVGGAVEERLIAEAAGDNLETRDALLLFVRKARSGAPHQNETSRPKS